MKNVLTRLFLALGYCIPFVFLAMNGDATSGTMWFYAILFFGLGTLCYCSIKTKNAAVVILGNVLSFASSYVFAYFFNTEKWQYYFKPFTYNELIIFETAIAFVIQILFVIYYVRKGKFFKC